MSAYSLLIDGALVQSNLLDEVIDPSTGSPLDSAPRATPAQIDAAVEAARRAFPAWSSNEPLRRRSLLKAAEILRANAAEIAALVVAETGKSIGFAGFEAAAAGSVLEHYAGIDISDEILSETEQKTVKITRRPLGVVAAIAPWNVPIILLFNKLAPALRAGNTVVAKPSEHTPLSTLFIAGLLKGVFPPGVLNVIAGDGDVGRQLASHSAVDKISFTGSVATGEKILSYAAAGVKRVTLELGGNDPAIVLEDASPDLIVEKLFWGAFRNSGQICFAIKRLYVHEKLFDTVVGKLAERAERTVVGPGSNPASELGPLISRAQRDRLEGLVEDARSHGARIHAGGFPLPGPGFFYRPAIVTDVGSDAALVQQEQFGPALPVIAYSNLDDAVRQANDTKFGLGASVWSSDEKRATEVVQRIEAGLAWVNTHAEIHPGSPIGGHKSSGLGVEGGIAGYDHYVNLQVLNVTRA